MQKIFYLIVALQLIALVYVLSSFTGQATNATTPSAVATNIMLAR